MEKTKAEVSHAVTVHRDGIIPNPKKKLLDQEPVLKLGEVLRRGILDGAEAARSEHPRRGL